MVVAAAVAAGRGERSNRGHADDVQQNTLGAEEIPPRRALCLRCGSASPPSIVRDRALEGASQPAAAVPSQLRRMCRSQSLGSARGHSGPPRESQTIIGSHVTKRHFALDQSGSPIRGLVLKRPGTRIAPHETPPDTCSVFSCGTASCPVLFNYAVWPASVGPLHLLLLCIPSFVSLRSSHATARIPHITQVVLYPSFTWCYGA